MSERRASFGEVLRRLRSAAALSQEDLAERAGLSRNGISDLERGARLVPRLETVRLLADGLALGDADRAMLVAAARPVLWQEGAGDRRSVRPDSLPRPLTRLIGRDMEVATLRASLQNDDVRLLTITGPGGVGKTRLAVEVASRLRGAFPDGVYFVDLSPLTDPALVAPTMAAALGVPEIAGQPIIQTIAAFLAPKRLLLILDNCERVLRAAPDVIALLAAGPGVTILATSRETFHLQGEREFPVLPLLLPDAEQLPALPILTQIPAVALFLERATARQPGFALGEENALAIVAICRRLDGLPLAIELAAARVKSLPPAALLARLDRRLPVLTGGGRDLPARQRAMRDAVAWSYDLLSPEEQALFRQLAVFAGGFTLSAAEAVVAPDPQLVALDGVMALVEQSLLRQIPGAFDEPRFLILETVREFGLEQLIVVGEADDARRRHAEHFLQLSAGSRYDGSVLMNLDSLARLVADLDNVRLALAWYDGRGDGEALLRLSSMLYGMLYGQWLTHGLYREGLQWLERALERSSHVASAALVRALAGAGTLAILQGDYARAATFLAKAQALSAELGDPSLTGEVLAYSGYLSYRHGDYVRADRLLEEGLRLLRSNAESAHRAFPLLIIGDCALAQEQLERAAVSYQEAIDGFQAADYERGLSDAQTGLAGVNSCAGDFVLAAAQLREILDRSWDLGFPTDVASALIGLAAAAAASGQSEAGAHLLGAAEGMIATIGAPMFPRDQPIRTRGLAMLRAALGEGHLATARETGRLMGIEDVIIEAQTVAEAIEVSAPAERR